MVFCGIYPVDGAEYDDLRDALEKLQLNDAAFSYEPETSVALGFGFRCGFLGLLHMEIIQERLRARVRHRPIATCSERDLQGRYADGQEIEVDNPAIPAGRRRTIEWIEEPMDPGLHHSDARRIRR